MDKAVFLFVTLTICINYAYGVLKIIDLKVPSTIESGSNDEVILDCDFVATNESGLEVKWFYNNGDEQIYQWIPNTSKPQALGFLKDRLDLGYKASNESNTMYRALRIRHVTLDLTGDYTCKVTSFYSEDTATKRMVIYEPAKEFSLDHLEDTDTVICSASGIYPEPKMNIYIVGSNSTTANGDDNDNDDDDNDNDKENDDNGNDNGDNNKQGEDNNNNHNNDDDDDDENDNNNIPHEESNEDNDLIEMTDDKSYNVTAVLSYEEEKLDDVTAIVCELWIPGTTYKEVKKTYLYRGGIPTTSETQIESDYDNEFATNATQEESSGYVNIPRMDIIITLLSGGLLWNLSYYYF